MPRKSKLAVDDTIREKLDYIGLDFEEIPKSLLQIHNLKFRALKGYDEKQYKQYKFINIKDIDILLTPTNRLNEIKEKYEKARPLYMYLDTKTEENILRHTTFLNMLKKVEISEIEKVAKEQEMLAKGLPFKVKYNGNYLWQIYYSEQTERYFMLVPTEDSDYSTFFYLMKKKIENEKDAKIFVPISYADYSTNILKKSELRDLENYLWLFTKDYPSIYEVYDKKGTETLQIIGETQVYGKIKTLYKMTFDSAKEANKFYKLLKALFILQVELPHYYNFTTNIDDKGNLEIYLDSTKIEYETLLEFVLEQYVKSINLKEKNTEEIENLNIKLANLKKESAKLENEYIEKEKQISTFLECKKSFFGKVKYYFKFGKKTNKNMKKVKDITKESKDEDIKIIGNKRQFKIEDRNYTLDELVISFKELEIIENNKKNTALDINAIKLKNRNLKKKIENATAYINEINEHKKSIFEFWKYSNKDEVASLEEGEAEEINVTKIEKTFNFDDDFEKFGENADKLQRMRLSDSELDSAYIASTELLELINNTYKKKADVDEFVEAVKILRAEKESENDNDEEFDVFGKLSSDKTKERNLGTKTHREVPRDKFEILEVRKSLKGQELKKSLVSAIKDIKRALKKITLEEDIYVYKAISNKLEMNEFQTFSLNEETEMQEFLSKKIDGKKGYLYKIKIPKGTNYIAFSNIVYYNNQNMTLPVGMQLSNKILLDLTTLSTKQVDKKIINIIYLENNKNDFSKKIIKNIEINEVESDIKNV